MKMDKLDVCQSLPQSTAEPNENKNTQSPIKSRTHSPALSYLSEKRDTPERNDSGAEDVRYFWFFNCEIFFFFFFLMVIVII